MIIKYLPVSSIAFSKSAFMYDPFSGSKDLPFDPIPIWQNNKIYYNLNFNYLFIHKFYGYLNNNNYRQALGLLNRSRLDDCLLHHTLKINMNVNI